MTSGEMRRWLDKNGCTFEPAKGGHVIVRRAGKRSVLPMHGSRHELPKSLVYNIKKQLGLK